MERIGYDSDTQTYFYRDANGDTWKGAEGAEGAEYSEMTRGAYNHLYAYIPLTEKLQCPALHQAPKISKPPLVVRTVINSLRLTSYVVLITQPPFLIILGSPCGLHDLHPQPQRLPHPLPILPHHRRRSPTRLAPHPLPRLVCAEKPVRAGYAGVLGPGRRFVLGDCD